MYVFPLLDGVATFFGSIQQFSGQTLGHGLLTALAGEVDDPAHCQRLTTARANFDRHLVGRATDPARLDLDRRGHRIQRLFDQLAGELRIRQDVALEIGMLAGHKFFRYEFSSNPSVSSWASWRRIWNGPDADR